MPNVQRDTLSPENERWLRELAEGTDLTTRRRARLILRWHAGDTQAEIAETIEMSVSGVSNWVRQYRENGMAVFGSANDNGTTDIPTVVTAPAAVDSAAPIEPAVVLPVAAEPPAKP